MASLGNNAITNRRSPTPPAQQANTQACHYTPCPYIAGLEVLNPLVVTEPLMLKDIFQPLHVQFRHLTCLILCFKNPL